MLRPFSWAGQPVGLPAKHVFHVKDLLQELAELQEAVRSLCGIRAAEEELDRWFQTELHPQPMARNSHQHTGKGGGPKMQKNGSLPWQGPVGRDFPPKTEVSPQSHFAPLRLETPIISEEILKPRDTKQGSPGSNRKGLWSMGSFFINPPGQRERIQKG